MKRESKRRSAHSGALPPEIAILLQEIEKEPVPERLLQLARQLQEALAAKRRKEEIGEVEQAGPPSRLRAAAKQSR